MLKPQFALAITAMFGVILAVSTVRAAEESKLASKDAKFLRSAAQSGLMTADLAKLAADRAANEEVKKLAQKVADDHGKANDELKTLAQNKGLDLQKALDTATKRSQRETEDMSKRKGADFDKSYLDMLVKAVEAFS